MTVDVYRNWLGIKETERPLNLYQLLRLPKFEDRTPKIREHYRKMNQHVRKYATGDYGPQSQALMNELAQAMLCLTDAKRKREYDASLGRKDEGGLRRRTFEEILLADGKVDQKQIDKARHFADAVGLEIRDAALQQKLAEPDEIMLAYAESIGLPYIELDDLGVVEALIPLIPPNTARHHSCVPVMADEKQVLMASPHPLVPDVEDDLRLRFGKTVRTVLCTTTSINEAVSQYFPPDAPQPATPTSSPKKEKKAKAKKEKQAKAKKETEPTATQEPKKVKPKAELKKQKLLMSFVGFNIGVMMTVFGTTILFGVPMASFGIVNYLTAFVVGCIFGGVGYLFGDQIS